MTGTLTWWGHSTSTWQDGDTTVLFDPVLTARMGHLRRVRGPVPPSRAAHADIILISHLHADHAHLPSLRLIPASAVLVAPAGSRRLLKPIAARGLKLHEVEPGELVELAAYRYMSWPPTTTAGGTLGALIADPHSAISLRAPAGAGIRGTRAHTLRSRTSLTSTSP